MQLRYSNPDKVLAVFIKNIIDWEEPVPEMLAVNYVFRDPWTVLVPTADTSEQSKNEQVVDG